MGHQIEMSQTTALKRDIVIENTQFWIKVLIITIRKDNKNISSLKDEAVSI